MLIMKIPVNFILDVDGVMTDGNSYIRIKVRFTKFFVQHC